jgi:hypothetical protein
LRANPGGVSLCSDDIMKYCSSEAYGEGDINKCLQSHLNNKKKNNKNVLSDECSELQLSILKDETLDFFANPFMEIACENEKEKYCSGIKDGQSRIQTCLSAQLQRKKSSISLNCQKEIQSEWISAQNVKKRLSLYIYKYIYLYSHIQI